MASRVLAGLDLGTTSVKALLCTPDGRIVAESAIGYPLTASQPGYVEQDAEAICRAASQVLRQVVESAGDSAEVSAVGISSAMHGVVAVDDAGTPLTPLYNWMDRRAAGVAERWRQDGTAARLYARTGAPVHPMLPSCKLRWLSENEPVVFARAARFVGLKELLVYRWTGEWLVDAGIASATGLLSVSDRGWDSDALAAAGIEPDRLSTPVPPSTSRAMRASAASALGLSEKTVLVLASSDGALANLGSGAVAPGDVAVTLGTSGAVRVVTATPSLDPHGRTFNYAFDDSRSLVGGPTSSAGAVLNRIFALLFPDIAEGERFAHATALADDVAAGARGLTLVPFLAGERAPYWRSDLRGALVGLDLAHGAAEIVRATFESVVFALADVNAILAERIGPAKWLRLSGGLMRAPLVCQLVADTFEVEATAGDHDEASAFGAALMAGLASGAVADLSEAASLSHELKHYLPRPAARDAVRSAYERYHAAVDATLPLFEGNRETFEDPRGTEAKEDRP